MNRITKLRLALARLLIPADMLPTREEADLIKSIMDRERRSSFATTRSAASPSARSESAADSIGRRLVDFPDATSTYISRSVHPRRSTSSRMRDSCHSRPAPDSPC